MDFNSIKIAEILLSNGLINNTENLFFQPLKVNRDRKDSGYRKTYRVLCSDATVCHLTIGYELFQLYSKAQAFYDSCPTILCKPLFYESTEGLEYFGQEFFDGISIEDSFSQKIHDPLVIAHAVNTLLEHLNATIKPSSYEALKLELLSFKKEVLETLPLNTFDVNILNEIIFPLIVEDASSYPLLTRWSNGDFIGRNILINKEANVKLIDYEFAGNTHLFWEDYIRFEEFSLLPKDLVPAVREQVQRSSRAQYMYFWLHQLMLEHRTNLPHHFYNNAGSRVETIFDIAKGTDFLSHNSLFVRSLSRQWGNTKNLVAKLEFEQQQRIEVTNQINLQKENHEKQLSAFIEANSKQAERIAALEHHANELQLGIDSILASLSWRATAPIRGMINLLLPVKSKRRAIAFLAKQVFKDPKGAWNRIRNYDVGTLYNYLKSTDTASLEGIAARGFSATSVIRTEINTHLESLINKDFKPDTHVRTEIVDIILPVYNAYDFTVKCVDTVFRNSAKCRLIIINDCSTDDRIAPFLDSLTSRPENAIEVIVKHNEQNLGFVQTVNLAFTYTNHNFVILNSDTEVPPGWLDRLFRPIFNNTDIATVTPFSNSATICSFPNFCQDNDIYLGLDTEVLDAFFEKYGQTIPVDIPTGVGFCMAFSRNIALKIGMFNIEVFGRGYGEENDFCMRAIKAGYRNVLIPNLFVYHKHGASFSSAEKKAFLQENYSKLLSLHPEYSNLVHQFISSDPIKNIRDTVALMTRIRSRDRRVFCILDFELTGGAKLYSKWLTKKLSDSGEQGLILSYSKEDKALLLTSFDSGDTSRISYLSTKTFKEVMHLVQPDHIIINEIITWPAPLEVLQAISSLGIQYSTFVHDYFYVCPNWCLMGEQSEFCGLPAKKQCELCLKHNNFEFEAIYPGTRIDKSYWNSVCENFLRNSHSIFCFSTSSREILLSQYGQLDNIVINEHSIPQNFFWKERILKASNIFVIAIVGNINTAKGISTVKSLIDDSRFKNLRVRLIMVGEHWPPLNVKSSVKDKVVFHGAYVREELPEILESYNVSAVLVPSVIPETFSYTTSEALLLGYPVICHDFGAPAERIRKYECGIVIDDVTTDSLISEIYKILQEPKIIQALSRNAQNYHPPSEEDHFMLFLQCMEV